MSAKQQTDGRIGNSESQRERLCGVEVSATDKQAEIKPSVRQLLPVPVHQLLWVESESSDDVQPVLVYIHDAWPAASWEPRTALEGPAERNSVADIMVEVSIRELSTGTVPLTHGGYDIQDDEEAMHIRAVNAGCIFGGALRQMEAVPEAATYRVLEDME